MKIIIRPARIEDLARICTLEREIFGSDAYDEAYMQYLFWNTEVFLVATKPDGYIVGYIICRIEGRKGHIINIGVHPNYQHRGIGSKLMVTLESNIRKLVDGK